MSNLTQITGLSDGLLVYLTGIAFLAGAIRGFSGFALSAFVVACAAAVIRPVELVPMLWFLEMSASLLLMKGGWNDADRPMAIQLFIFSALGMPVGLLISLSLPATTSKAVALALLATLAAMQLARIRLEFLNTRWGVYAAGLTAGLATGIASVGGMCIALFVLARNIPARKMRGTLNIYMLGAGALGLVTHLLIGTMDTAATARGIFLIIPTLAGVFLGKALFTPRYEPYYKPVCLTLLIGLAVIGLARLGLQGA